MKRDGIVQVALTGLIHSMVFGCAAVDGNANQLGSPVGTTAIAPTTGATTATGEGASTAGTAAASMLATVSSSASLTTSSSMGTSITPPVETTRPALSSSSIVPPVTSSAGISGASSSASSADSGSPESSSTSAPPGPPALSDGCGVTPAPAACDTQDAPCTTDIEGTERTYWVKLPDDYDAARPYPVVFQYHPLGGNGWQGLSMYQIRPKFPDAIYVSPDGLKSGQNQGFSNTGGVDEALTRAMMEDLESKYCVDKERYFATGFSFGGSMSFTAGCNMSDVFRAIGSMAGAPISGATCATVKPERRVAIWATHGDMDTALPITMAQPMIDALAEYNGCSTTTMPVDPSPCVEFQNCAAGYPVVWCVRPGDGHTIPSFGAQAIATFFQQF
jgi:polyhydroxybutyrate depolymerase